MAIVYRHRKTINDEPDGTMTVQQFRASFGKKVQSGEQLSWQSHQNHVSELARPPCHGFVSCRWAADSLGRLPWDIAQSEFMAYLICFWA